MDSRSFFGSRRWLGAFLFWCATGALWAGACVQSAEPDPPPIQSPPPPPPATFTIGLDPASVTFTDTAGTSSPVPRTVNVTNTGTGTVTGLALGTSAYGTGASGWLSAQLSGTQAPATLTLTPANAGLPPGMYTVTVPVSSNVASNSPQIVAVTFTVDPPPPPPPPPPVAGTAILAGGTFGRCGGDLAAASAAVLAAANPAYLFVLGDNAQPQAGEWATLQDYQACYDPLFGPLKGITYAAVGDRDQDTTTGPTRGFSPGADAYFGPERVGAPHRNYYSFDIGSWHVIVLNVISGGLKRPITYDNSSAQIAWLREDLAEHRDVKCVIAFWHDPLWKSSTSPPTANDTNPNHSYRDQPVRGVWMALRDYGADVVVNGGRNIYERFAPMRYDGNYEHPTPLEFAADSLGPRQFTTGLVGDGPTTTPAVDVTHPLSEYRSGGNGFLQLILGDGVYSWEFLNTRFSNIQDRGNGRCH